MITQEKFKLFSNDPKFRSITNNNKNALELTILKIYAAQNQIRRQDVIMDSISKRNDPRTNQLTDSIDFIQSRTQALEEKLLNDIENFYHQKQQIESQSINREKIQLKIDQKLQGILTRIEELEVLSESRQFQQLDQVEQLIHEIQHINDTNTKLKQQNAQIQSRIREKHKKLGIRTDMRRL